MTEYGRVNDDVTNDGSRQHAVTAIAIMTICPQLLTINANQRVVSGSCKGYQTKNVLSKPSH